jgi:hypothetical protein
MTTYHSHRQLSSHSKKKGIAAVFLRKERVEFYEAFVVYHKGFVVFYEDFVEYCERRVASTSAA